MSSTDGQSYYGVMVSKMAEEDRLIPGQHNELTYGEYTRAEHKLAFLFTTQEAILEFAVMLKQVSRAMFKGQTPDPAADAKKPYEEPTLKEYEKEEPLYCSTSIAESLGVAEEQEEECQCLACRLERSIKVEDEAGVGPEKRQAVEDVLQRYAEYTKTEKPASPLQRITLLLGFLQELQEIQEDLPPRKEDEGNASVS
ncbi:MAG: hypothetical protein HKN43_04595 [Rhodothermales bacterium]|nr:hypothetical protein [Rhodothermales bacterium]